MTSLTVITHLVLSIRSDSPWSWCFHGKWWISCSSFGFQRGIGIATWSLFFLIFNDTSAETNICCLIPQSSFKFAYESSVLSVTVHEFCVLVLLPAISRSGEIPTYPDFDGSFSTSGIWEVMIKEQANISRYLNTVVLLTSLTLSTLLCVGYQAPCYWSLIPCSTTKRTWLGATARYRHDSTVDRYTAMARHWFVILALATDDARRDSDERAGRFFAFFLLELEVVDLVDVKRLLGAVIQVEQLIRDSSLSFQLSDVPCFSIYSRVSKVISLDVLGWLLLLQVSAVDASSLTYECMYEFRIRFAIGYCIADRAIHSRRLDIP